MKKVLMIIAPKDFRDEELFETKEIIEKIAEVKIASTTIGTVKGMLGKSVNPDIPLARVNVDDYDAIIFVGGVGASVYFKSATALNIAKNAYEKGKIIGAICIAPSILANAGILKGKKVTSWPSEASNLRSNGAFYTGSPVEIDKNIITANGPQSAKKFGEAILEALK
ncbi:MAG: DJ-1/PfpI family protein [Candidatus Aenigmatarchaeota archaeon]